MVTLGTSFGDHCVKSLIHIISLIRQSIVKRSVPQVILQRMKLWLGEVKQFFPRQQEAEPGLRPVLEPKQKCTDLHPN